MTFYVHSIMDIKTALFYVFAAILVVSAFRVITARNPVHAALFLVLSFFTAACLWMLLKAEFLAISLVLVYVGAVMVLFLFVVMMLDINTDKLREGFWRSFPLAAVVGAVIVAEIVAVIWQAFAVTQTLGSAAAAKVDNTKALGMALYSQYVYPAQVAAVVLLVAIIAAIALTLRKRKDSRSQDASAQIRVQAKDRFRMVKMAPTISTPAKPAQDKPHV
jgi:NADH-quinone oxidoreductase subunit J